MNLSELAEELEAELELTARRMAVVKDRLSSLRGVLGGTGRPPDVTRPPPPTLDRSTDDVPSITTRANYVDPLVWSAAEEEAPKHGLRPVTLVAIQVWESAWYTSRLFRTANNVGGIKYRPDLPGLGHVHGSYTAADGNVYAAFPSWRAGVAAHAQFLSQRRYDAVRQTDDALAETRAIHDAGYAEHSQEWLSGVSGLVRKFQKEGHS